MRLYAKLAVIVLLAVATQWTLKHTQTTDDNWWFAARCGFAFAMKNEAMQDRLVEEARTFSCQCPDDPILVNASGLSD